MEYDYSKNKRNVSFLYVDDKLALPKLNVITILIKTFSHSTIHITDVEIVVNFSAQINTKFRDHSALNIFHHSKVG